MSLPKILEGKLELPIIAAPMFLVSGTKLVTESCKNGIVGTFPALNARTSEMFESWLIEIKDSLESYQKENPEKKVAPFGVNLIVHNTNPRLQADLALCVKHKVPLIITSLGAVSELVGAIHSYGGVVFHDVTQLRHAKKAAGAGVDGLIAVAAGAGGHAGTISPFALLDDIRSFFDKTVLLAGSISNGNQVAAAKLMGADLAYMGTRFINTQESLAAEDYKDMIIESTANDIIHTAAVSGIPANFMAGSLEKAGFNVDEMKKGKSQAPIPKTSLEDEAKAWKNIWSAGHGTSSIHDKPAVKDLIERLKKEYEVAKGLL